MGGGGGGGGGEVVRCEWTLITVTILLFLRAIQQAAQTRGKEIPREYPHGRVIDESQEVPICNALESRSPTTTCRSPLQ